MNPFDYLTSIQTKVGYTPGDINIIALLGLFGEAGEVLNEVALLSDSGEHEKFKQLAVNIAEIIDDLKKHLRDKSNAAKISVFLDPDLEKNFEKEMANVTYYLNALAINRGKDLAYFADLAVKIALEKSQKDISHGSINKETYNPESSLSDIVQNKNEG